MKLLGFNITRETRSSLENPTVPISDPAALALFFGEALGSTAGVTVTTERALGVPAVWNAVAYLSSILASLPLYVFIAEDRDHSPLASILHDAVNDEMTSFAWRKWVMVQVLTVGRSFTFIDRSPSGRVIGLYPLETGDVTVERIDGRTQYKVNTTTLGGASQAIYQPRDIIDVMFMPGPNLVSHRSPIQTLRNTIGLAIAIEEYGSRFFQAGGVPPLQLVGPFTSPQGAERAGFDIGKAIKSVKQKGGNVLPLPTGHELKAIGVSPEQGQMIEARKFILTEIARIYGLPPSFLQDLERATFSNSEQQDVHLVKHVVTPWVTAWEQELNLKLTEPDSGVKVKFNADGLLRGDCATRMAGHATSVQNSIRTPNEVRALENLPPLEGGDELLIQSATIPLRNQQNVTIGNTSETTDEA